MKKLLLCLLFLGFINPVSANDINWINWYKNFAQEVRIATTCDQFIKLLIRFLSAAEDNSEMNQYIDDLAFCTVYDVDTQKLMETKYGKKYWEFHYLTYVLNKNECEKNTELKEDMDFIEQNLSTRQKEIIKKHGTKNMRET